MIAAISISWLVFAVCLLIIALRGSKGLFPLFFLVIVSYPILSPSTASDVFLRGTIFRLIELLLMACFSFSWRKELQLPDLGPFRTYFWFIGACFLSALVSTSPLEALVRVSTYLEPLVYFYFAMLLAYNYEEGFDVSLRYLMIAIIIPVIVGIINIVSQHDVMADSGFTVETLETFGIADYILDKRTFSGRITSTLMQPVYAAFFFIAVSSLPLYHLFRRKGIRFHWLALLLIILLLIYTTGTRASYPVIGFIIVFLLLTYGIKRPGLIIGVLIVAMLFFSLFVTEEAVDFFTDSVDFTKVTATNTNTVFRIGLTIRLFELALERPLLGHGPGIIQKASAGTGLSYQMHLEGLSGQENHFLVILADTGFIGLFCYAWFLFDLLKNLRRIAKEGSKELSVFANVLFAVTIAFYAGSLTVLNLTSVAGVFLFVQYGLILGRWSREIKIAG